MCIAQLNTYLEYVCTNCTDMFLKICIREIVLFLNILKNSVYRSRRSAIYRFMYFPVFRAVSIYCWLFTELSSWLLDVSLKTQKMGGNALSVSLRTSRVVRCYICLLWQLFFLSTRDVLPQVSSVCLSTRFTRLYMPEQKTGEIFLYIFLYQCSICGVQSI